MKNKTQIEDTNEPKIEDIKTTEGAAGTTTADDIGATLVAQMSAVSEHAIEHEKEKIDAKHAEYADLVDASGAAFDPEIHKTDKNGAPTLSPRGKLIKKPKGKTGEQGKKSTVGGIKSEPQRTPEDDAREQSRAVGVVAAAMLINIGMVVGGEEWAPKEHAGHNERDILSGAFADYFEQTGRTDFPPSMALAIAVAGYALPRFTMPKTQKKIGGLKLWIAKKIAARKIKKMEKVQSKKDAEKDAE